MAIGEESYQEAVYKVFLADDHTAHLLLQGPHPCRGLMHGIANCLDARKLGRCWFGVTACRV